MRLRSPAGEAVVPVTLSPRVEAGSLLAPFGLREALTDVLGGQAVERVEVERT